MFVCSHRRRSVHDPLCPLGKSFSFGDAEQPARATGRPLEIRGALSLRLLAHPLSASPLFRPPGPPVRPPQKVKAWQAKPGERATNGSAALFGSPSL